MRKKAVFAVKSHLQDKRENAVGLYVETEADDVPELLLRAKLIKSLS